MSDTQLWVIYYQHEQDHRRPVHYGDYDSEADALAAINTAEGSDLKSSRKTVPHYQFDERHYYVARVI